MEISGLVADLRLELLGKLLLAAALGGAVGLEREVHGKPAGFRTNLLICVGSALLTDLSLSIAGLAQGVAIGGLRGDPARLAAQIVSGIGFLGAGTILQSRGSITGLTTAATLWVVAAIGIAVGSAAFVAAIGTTVLVLAALLLLGRVERRLVHERRARTLRLLIEGDGRRLEAVVSSLEAAGYHVHVDEVERREGVIDATLELSGPRGTLEKSYEVALAEPGVVRVRLVGG